MRRRRLLACVPVASAVLVGCLSRPNASTPRDGGGRDSGSGSAWDPGTCSGAIDAFMEAPGSDPNSCGTGMYVAGASTSAFPSNGMLQLSLNGSTGPDAVACRWDHGLGRGIQVVPGLSPVSGTPAAILRIDVGSDFAEVDESSDDQLTFHSSKGAGSAVLAMMPATSVELDIDTDDSVSGVAVVPAVTSPGSGSSTGSADTRVVLGKVSFKQASGATSVSLRLAGADASDSGSVSFQTFQCL